MPFLRGSTYFFYKKIAALAKYRESLAGTKTFSEALQVEQNAEPTEAQVEEAKKTKQQDEEFDNLANEKVKGYDKLSAANKIMIRKIFREAKATSISDADALSYARVAARTGLDINSVNSFDLYKLGAVKGKKIDNPNSALKRGAAVTGQNPLISSGYRTISITDFLGNVKTIPLSNFFGIFENA